MVYYILYIYIRFFSDENEKRLPYERGLKYVWYLRLYRQA